MKRQPTHAWTCFLERDWDEEPDATRPDYRRTDRIRNCTACVAMRVVWNATLKMPRIWFRMPWNGPCASDISWRGGSIAPAGCGASSSLFPPTVRARARHTEVDIEIDADLATAHTTAPGRPPRLSRHCPSRGRPSPLISASPSPDPWQPEHSYEDHAAAAGMPVGTFRSRLSRAPQKTANPPQPAPETSRPIGESAEAGATGPRLLLRSPRPCAGNRSRSPARLD